MAAGSGISGLGSVVGSSRAEAGVAGPGSDIDGAGAAGSARCWMKDAVSGVSGEDRGSAVFGSDVAAGFDGVSVGSTVDAGAIAGATTDSSVSIGGMDVVVGTEVGVIAGATTDSGVSIGGMDVVVGTEVGVVDNASG